MAIREAINKHQGWVAAVAFIGIMACLVWLFTSVRQSNVKPDSPMSYYSDDDGKSYFSGSVFLVAPFNHGGKEAVRARVFTTNNGGKRFVGYLEKYAPEAREMFRPVEGNIEKQVALIQKLRGKGLLVKKPGQAEWIPADDPLAAAVKEVRGPDGEAAHVLLPDDE